MGIRMEMNYTFALSPKTKICPSNWITVGQFRLIVLVGSLTDHSMIVGEKNWTLVILSIADDVFNA
jgi:hypothetical protein